VNSAWLPEKGTHILESEFTILEFPKTDDGSLGCVIIGQIHGPEDELVRFYVDGATGEAYFVDDKAGPKRKETKFSLVDAGGRKTKVRIGDRVRRRIEVRDRVLTVTAVVNGRTYSASEPLSAFWANKPCYFKDGVYNAVHALDVEEGVRGAGRARVAFHKLGRPTHY
jgi:Alginate lyase